MDPSQASVNANRPGQTETITCMDSDSYNAAAEGKIEVFEDIIDHESLGLLLTPNKNTILHIYITALNSTTPNAGSESTTTLIGRSGSTTNFVKKILKMCPSLLRQANANGETPLHIAARYGHDDIVEVLIKYCAQTDQDLEEGIQPVKEMLRMTNKEKDTALHEAVRYNHLKVVELLIKEDPKFSYSANDAGETPLYIAAERGFKDVLFEILDKCKSPMHEGPLRRTALHAAVIRGDTGMVRRIILEKIDGISKKVDKNNCTPLHLAAYFDRKDIAELLIDKDRKVAYMKDTMSRTPLHIAAQRGCYAVVKAIVKRCPDCCEQVDNRGWNVLHFAIKGEKAWLQEDIMDIIIKNSSFSNLLNEKNADGDTPLHFYSTSSESLELKTFVSHPRVDKMAFTKQHHNAMDIASTNKKMSEFKDAPQRVLITYEDDTTKLEDKEKERDKQDREEKEKKEKEEKEGKEKRIKLQKASEVHLVVAALIATVTFAACITMPGGFVGGGEGSHPGSVNLRRNVAFKVFVTTDIISMVLSSLALFIYLLMPFYLDIDYDYEERTIKIGVLAFKFILWAMVAMGLAFVTGTYAVLLPSLNLAIINGTIGLTFFFFLPYVFRQFPSVTFSTIFHALCPWKLDL